MRPPDDKSVWTVHKVGKKKAVPEERVPLPKFLKEWNEEDHPRDEAGRFGEGGGGGGGGSSGGSSGGSTGAAVFGHGNAVYPSLQQHEANAMRDYVQGGTVVDESTGKFESTYDKWNNAMRDGTVGDLPAEDQEGIKSLMSALESQPRIEGPATLYRGIGTDSTPMQILRGEDPMFRPGAIISESGFISTSTDFKIAAGFAAGSAHDAEIRGNDGGAVVLQIEAPSGTMALDIGAHMGPYSSEDEVLLAPGTRYEVVSVGMDPTSEIGSLVGSDGGYYEDAVNGTDVYVKVRVLP